MTSGRRTMLRQGHERRPQGNSRLLIWLAITLVLLHVAARLAPATLATAQDSHKATTTATAGSIGTPTSVSASTTTSCSSITISWNAGTDATSYEVQVKVGTGDWTVLDGDTGNVTTIYDTTGYSSATVYYRVAGLRAGTSWRSTLSTQASIVC